MNTYLNILQLVEYMPAKSKIEKTAVKSKSEKILVNTEDTINNDELAEDMDNFDIDDEAEDEFFNEKSFEDFNKQIKFYVHDPNKYENEIHKEINIVKNNNRRTSEIITKFEFTEVTSVRAKQIENGGKIFVDIQNETDPVVMAEMEIKMKCCPLSVRRMISSEIAEIWDVNDMIIPYIK